MCVYAQQVPGGLCFVDKDGAISLVEKYERETGRKFPRTLLVRSSIVRNLDGTMSTKGHWYFYQTPRTRTASNIAELKTGGVFSFRVNNTYVASIGSIHPTTGLPYAIADDAPVIPMPDEFLEWLQAQVVEKPKTRQEVVEGGELVEGTRYGGLMSELGRLWNQGTYSRKLIAEMALAWAKENFDIHADAFNEKLVGGEIEHFLDHAEKNYEQEGTAQAIELDGGAAAVAPEPAKITQAEYPKFPTWVMAGTSLYENFVKQICNVDSRIDYFMWMPAMAMLLNYVSPKIKIKSLVGERGFQGNIYMVVIGKRSQTMKSSSLADARAFFTHIGCLVSAGRDLKSAEGRTVTATVGSMESLGLTMQRTNAKSAILIYDELGTLVKKAGIEGSSMKDQMLTCYEGRQPFGNGVKATKESFSIEPPYCVSVIALTTTKKYPEQWAVLTDEDAGWDNRFTPILEPETLPEPRVYQGTEFLGAAVKTKALIDKALNQTVFEFEDLNDSPLTELVKIDNRLTARAEKWALALAIDLGLDTVDHECMARAVALVKYEQAVRKYMRVHAANNKEAQVQQVIRRALERKPNATMRKCDLTRVCKASQYGTTLWGNALYGLTKHGILHDDGKGLVSVIIPLDEEEDDE